MIEQIVSKLEGVIDRGNGRYYSLCPGHPDRSPSLSVAQGDDGRLLLHCFAGCEAESILSALGLSWTDIFPDKWEASKQAAHHAPTKKHKVDPLDHELLVLKIGAADLDAGESMTLEDRARMKAATLRLQAWRAEK